MRRGRRDREERSAPDPNSPLCQIRLISGNKQLVGTVGEIIRDALEAKGFTVDGIEGENIRTANQGWRVYGEAEQQPR